MSWKQRNQVTLGNNESYCPPPFLFAFQCTRAQTGFWATWLIILYIYTAFVFKKTVALYRHDLIYEPSIPKAGNGPGEFLFYGVLLQSESTWDSERERDLIKAASKFTGFPSNFSHHSMWPTVPWRGLVGCGSLHIHKHTHTQNREWTWLLLLPTTILLFSVTVPWISEAVCLSRTQSIWVRTYDPGLVMQSNFIPWPCDWHMSPAVLIRYKLHSSISASSAKRWYFDFCTVFVSFLKSFRLGQEAAGYLLAPLNLNISVFLSHPS